jgi:hypothetical protein
MTVFKIRIAPILIFPFRNSEKSRKFFGALKMKASKKTLHNTSK